VARLAADRRQMFLWRAREGQSLPTAPGQIARK